MLIALLAGLFGLLIGSFLNVCIHRMPIDKSVVRPRSSCPHCGALIRWYDNIPVLSYAFLQGRCRDCGASISWRYPVVELLTGVLFAAGFLRFGPGVRAIEFCVLAAIMVTLIFTDLEERILPDEFTLGGTLAGLAFSGFAPPTMMLLALFLPSSLDPHLVGLIEAAFSAFFLASVLWSFGSLYGRFRGVEALGLGDVKMVACMGAFLGLSPALLAIAIGSMLGSIIGVGWIVLGRRDWRTFPLPFGSFLGIGAIAVGLIQPGQYIL